MKKIIESFTTRFFSEKSPVLRTFAFLLLFASVIIVGGILETEPLNISLYVAVPTIIFVGVLINGVLYIQDIYELNAFWKVLNHLTASIFDGGLPSLRIVNGEREIVDGKINVVDQIGGPGILQVEPGNVVVLETLTAPSRIVGAGEHKISRGEMVKEVFMLGEYTGQINEFLIATRDGIDVKVSGVEYRFCINSRSQESSLRTMQNPYPFSKKSVYDLVYSRNVNAEGKLGLWTKAVEGAVKGIIADHISAHDLDALLSPPVKGTHPMYELRKKFDLPQNLDRIKAMGARLIWINIGNVVPALADIEEQRLKVWLAKQSGTARLFKAQGEAEKISTRERGRAESQTMLLRSIAQALQEVDSGNGHDKAKTAKNLWNIVLARTAQILESMSAAHEIRGRKGAKS